MFSNYSHDHIALDTMNIMANGQYIDRIMTKIQNLTSRQTNLSVNSAVLDPHIDDKSIKLEKKIVLTSMRDLDEFFVVI